MKKYSKIYSRGNKLFGFRYNYEDNMLEWISKWDLFYNKQTKEYEGITLPNWKVIDALGVDLDDWEDNPDYWVNYYQEKINEGCAFELDE